MAWTALQCRFGLGILLAAWAALVVAGQAVPSISLIIDDVGYTLAPGLRVVALPAPLACSIIPYTPYAAQLAEAAHRANKEVMLHVPMESEDGSPLGPGGLTHAMAHAELSRVLRADLALVPYVRGVNNHMGSLLTKDATVMAWIMAELKGQDSLFFIDSRTTPATVALDTAQKVGLVATRRDLFLDNVPEASAIRTQFARLVALARLQGTAVGIAHPRPATLAVLADLLPRLSGLGVRLAPISETVVRRASNPELLAHNPYGALPGADHIFDKKAQ